MGGKNKAEYSYNGVCLGALGALGDFFKYFLS